MSASENLLKQTDLFTSFKVKGASLNGLCENVQSQLNGSISSIVLGNAHVNNGQVNSLKDLKDTENGISGTRKLDSLMMSFNGYSNEEILGFCGQFLMAIKGVSDLIGKLDFYFTKEQETKNIEINNMKNVIYRLEDNQVKFKLIIQLFDERLKR